MSEMPCDANSNPLKRTILSDEIETELNARSKRPDWQFQVRESVCNSDSCDCNLVAVMWTTPAEDKPFTKTWKLGQIQKRGAKAFAQEVIEQLEVIGLDKSPEFDDNDFDGILEWAEAKVTLDDVYEDDDPTSYSLSWKHGWVAPYHLDVEEEEKARKAAALFIYLWTRGIHAGVAKRCATSYVRTHTVKRVE